MGETELESAVCAGDIDRVGKLLDSGVNIETWGSLGRSPLLLATSHNNPAIVKLLLARGADADALDIDKHTPLQVAVLLGLSQIVEALVAPGGADVNVKDRGGNTQLHKAAKWDDLAIVKILLANGAHKEIRDAAGLRAEDYPKYSKDMLALLKSGGAA